MFSLFKSKPYFNSKAAQDVFDRFSKEEQRNFKELSDLFLKKFDSKLIENKKLGLISDDVSEHAWVQDFLTNSAGLRDVGGWKKIDGIDKDELIKICCMVGSINFGFSKLMNENKNVFLDIFSKNSDNFKEVSVVDFDRAFMKFTKDKYGLTIKVSEGDLKISIKSHEHKESKLYGNTDLIGATNEMKIITRDVIEYDLDVYKTSELTYKISKVLAS